MINLIDNAIKYSDAGRDGAASRSPGRATSR